MASAVCLQRPAGDISDKHCQALHSIAYVAVVFANPMCYVQVLHFMLLAQHKQHHPAFATVSQSFNSGVRVQPAGA